MDFKLILLQTPVKNITNIFKWVVLVYMQILPLWCDATFALRKICKCFVFILEYTNPCLEENSISSDPQAHTHVWLRERAHAPCTHTHDILTIRNSAHTLICIDLPCVHATHQEHLPMTTLPHDHSCMSTETEPRSSVKWPRSTTDTKDLFQTPVNSLLSSICLLRQQLMWNRSS